jgi:branched-chain amino acid transport system permease protein
MSFIKKNLYFCSIVLGIFVIALPFVAGSFGAAWVRILDFALLYMMLALGLNIVVGFAGLLDLGFIAFYAVGAYLYALLNSPHLSNNFAWIASMFPDGFHVTLWWIIPLAALVAAFFGVLLGSPTLKLRGDYLAIVTLGFGEIIRIFMNNLDRPVNLTNGPKGITSIDPVSIFGYKFNEINLSFFGIELRDVHLYYFLFLIMCCVIIFVTYRLQNSRLGRAWVAIREDEIAAKAMGINTRNTKLWAFALGASFGGVSGAMFAAFQGFVSPESFTLMESISILAMVVLGGMGHIPGVILGSILLAAFPEVLRHVADPLQQALFGRSIIDAEVLRLLLYALGMILVMLFRPAGLWPKPVHEGDKDEVKPTVA